MDRRLFYFLLAGILLSPIAFASYDESTVPGVPCTIYIHTIRHNGERISQRFTTRLKAKPECVALSNLHRPNFESDSVKYKYVAYEWNKWPTRTVARTANFKKPLRDYVYRPPTKRTRMYVATYRKR
jgi:hypothetical protein